MSAHLLCQVISPAGPNREPMACAHEPGHKGTHSWDSLPTFTDGEVTDSRYTQIKLKPEYREKLKRLADRDKRSMANMVEVLINQEIASNAI